MRTSYVLFCVALSMLCWSEHVSSAQIAAQIAAVIPNRGSVMGGTKVTIKGTGFARGGKEGTTRVHFGNKPCEIIEYDSSDTQLVCMSPAHDTYDEVLAITVTMVWVGGGAFATCSTWCAFHYHINYTPLIYNFALGTSPGKDLNMEGYLRAITPDTVDIFVGGARCQLPGEADEEFAAKSNSFSRIACETPDITAGRYNVSLLARSSTHGWGDYKPSHGVLQADNVNGVYGVTVDARIDSLSSPVSGSNGGDVLTINGAGFSEDCEDNMVKLAGETCELVTCSHTKLTCIIAAAPGVLPTYPFPGNKGLRGRIYEGLTPANANGFDNFANYPDSPDESGVVSHGLTTLRHQHSSTKYGQDVEGFFVAPFSGDYEFWVLGDDFCDFFLSTDSDPANRVEVATTIGYGPTFYENPAQQSAPITLVEGERYSILMRHAENKGDDHGRVAVRLPSRPATGLELMHHTVSEVQSVSISATIRYEIQSITFTGATGGKFRIGGDDGFSDDLLLNNTNAGTFANAVKAATTCNNILASIENLSETSVRFNFTFRCATTQPFKQLSVLNTGLESSGTLDYQVVTTQQASAPVRGTFKLSLGSEMTEELSYQASNAEIRDALELLPSIDTVAVTAHGDVNYGRTWNVQVLKPQGDLALLSADGLMLTGEDVAVDVTVLQEGSTDLFYDPIPAEWLELSTTDHPSAIVTVNGLNAVCSDSKTENSDCQFRYDASVTPTMSAISVAGSPATVTEGDSITITGTGFSTNVDDVVVFHGDSECEIVSTAATTITCTLGANVKGTHSVDVIIAGAGKANHDTPQTLEYGFSVTAVAPLTGSAMGGSVLTISGQGFSDATTVTVDGNACTLLTSTATEVTCQTPVASGDVSSHLGAATTSVDISIDGSVFGSQFTYDWGLSPAITALSHAAVSAGVSTIVTFSGSFAGFAVSDASCMSDISVGGRACIEASIAADSSLSCTLPRAKPAETVAEQQNLTPNVRLCHPTHGINSAHVASGQEMNLELGIDAISHNSGSLAGGAEITITGRGFTTEMDQISVKLNITDSDDDVSCKVLSSTYTTIECVIELDTPYNTTHIGNFKVTVNLIESPCYAADCTYTFSDSSTPILSAVSPDHSTGPGSTLTLTGSNFIASPTVFLGSFPCAVSGFTAMEITCTIPDIVSGTFSVHADIPGLGRCVHENDAAFEVIIPVQMTSISPKAGSFGGGTEMTISGSGFSLVKHENTVSVNGNRVVVDSVASSSSMTIIVPFRGSWDGSAADEAVDVEVVVTPGDENAGHDHGRRRSAGHTTADTSSCTNVADCTFTYTHAVTPILSTVSPSDGEKGTTITIVGEKFGSVVGDVSVFIGGGDCVINAASFSSTGFDCVVGDVPAGTHRVIIDVAGNVAYFEAQRFTSNLQVDATTPTSGTFGGGTAITISGKGFSSLTKGTAVNVCGKPCVVTASSYNAVTCSTPSIDTETSVADFDHHTDEIMTGSASAGTSVNAYDEDLTTYASSSRGTCTLTFDFGEDTLGWLNRIRFFPRIRNSVKEVGGYFSTSVDGVTWDIVGNITTVQEGWNFIDITSTHAVRFGRYHAGPASSCQMAELEFVGIKLTNVDGASTDTCTVKAGVLLPAHHPSQAWHDNHDVPDFPTVNAESSTEFTYTSASTGIVTDISPVWGTALGGTTITVTGTDLPTVASDAVVTLSGIDCAVSAATGTSITCVTGARPELTTISVVVGHKTLGNAVVNPDVEFRYLDRWSALSTWSHEQPPVAGDSVVIPADQTVLLDVSPPKLKLLLILGSLIWDRKDLSLDAHYIFISGGRMEVGTENNPFLNRAVITLHGDRFKDVEIPHVGSKVLAVSDAGFTHHDHGAGHHVSTGKKGFLEIHGKPRLKTWTKVAATVAQGSNVITTVDKVDFAPGEKIIITSNGRNFKETEELVVQALSGDGKSITVTTSLKYEHKSTVETLGGKQVDMRCEVALLSRNIEIKGDDNSFKQSFGAHTIAAHGGTYRIENTELHDCGQAGNLGRYCVHFHMASHKPDCYVRMNSIHHSNQRAVTVHGTHQLPVQDNVAFHVHGHTYFVEDGNEKLNVFERNLGVWTMKLFNMLLSDVKATTFWTADPENIWRDNVAAGSEVFGFWFELAGHPNGPSFSTDICPQKSHLGAFERNILHSNGGHGLRIYPHWTPLEDPCDPTSTPTPMYLYDYTSFHNGGNGFFTKKSGDLHHIRAKYVQNGGSEVHWIKLIFVEYREDPHLKDILVVGDVGGGAGNTGFGIHTPQNEFFLVDGAKFVNMGSTGAIAGCNSCDSDNNMKQGGYTVRFKNLEWENTPSRTAWTSPFKQIFWDLDGSLTGFTGGWATPYYGFNEWAGCTKKDSTYDEGLVCDSSVTIRRLQMDFVEPRELDHQVLQIGGPKNDTIPFRVRELYGWVVPIIVEHQYDVNFVSTVDFQSMQLRYSEPELVPEDSTEWLRLRFGYTDYRFSYQVNYEDGEEVPAITEEIHAFSATDVFGTGQMDSQNDQWTVQLNNQVDRTLPINDFKTFRTGGPFNLNVKALQCAPGQCGMPGELPLGPPMLWSLTTSWTSGVLPKAGEDVEIPSGVWIIMDINPPKLKNLKISGKLQFEDTADRVLEADTILVWGFLEVGIKARPFTHKANIILHGIRTSPTLIAHDTHFLGNKVLANFGRMDLHGERRTVHWTRLAQTANAGDLSIVLSEAVDWVAGDRISITSTDYEPSEVEDLEIASVSGDMLTITFTTALQYKHIAGVVEYGNNEDAVFAAAAGLLTHNIVVEGALSSASDTYGAHLVSGDVIFDEGVKVGSTHMTNVQLYHCGKQDSEHAAFTWKYTSSFSGDNIPQNELDGVAFTNSFNYGVVSWKTTKLELYNNVFHRTQRTAVDMDEASTGALIEGNLVVGNYRSAADKVMSWTKQFAGFFLNTRVASLKNNLVGGSEDTGYAFIAEDCDVSEPTISGNEAHGCLVGAFMLSYGNNCLQLNNFVAWKNAHLGIVTVDQTSNIQLENVVVSDNHIGISLNFIRGSVDSLVEIISSVIMGSTSASECGKSEQCRAMDVSDPHGMSRSSCRSVMGNNWRRVGLLMPQYLNAAKTCHRDGRLMVCRPPTTPERMCSMPWEKRYGLPTTQYSQIHLTDTVFAHFKKDDCGRRSVGLTTNPTMKNQNSPITISGARFHMVESDAKFDLGRHDHFSECSTGCDALMFMHGTDLDGSFMGSAGSFISSTNPDLTPGNPDRCSSDNDNNMFVCPGLKLVSSSFESKDADRGGRRIGPIQVFNNAIEANEVNRTYFSVGPFKDMCPIRMHFGQFPLAFEPNREYNVFSQNTLPSNLRISFFSSNTNEAVLLRIFFGKPMSVSVFVNGKKKNLRGTVPTLADDAGEFVLDPQKRTLYLVMRGGDETQRYDIRTLNTVQLTMTLSISLEEFFGDELVNNLATLLDINPARIRVVEVHAVGSNSVSGRRRLLADAVEALVEIDDEGGLTPEDEEVEVQLERLNNIIETVEETAASGELESTLEEAGMPIAVLDVTPPAGNGAGAVQFNVPLSSSAEPSSSTNTTPIIVGAVVACVVVALVLLLFVMHRRKQRKPSVENSIGESHIMTSSMRGNSGSAKLLPVSSPKRSSNKITPMEEKITPIDENQAMTTEETEIDPLDGFSKPVWNPDSQFEISERDTRTDAELTVEELAARYREREEKARAEANNRRASVKGHSGMSVKDRAAALKSVKYRMSKKTWDYVPNHSWYHPNVTKEEATEFLLESPSRSFIVIGKESPVLLVNASGAVQSFDLETTDEGDQRLVLNDNEQEPEPLCDDLASLIERYQTEQPGVPFVLADEYDNPPYASKHVMKLLDLNAHSIGLDRDEDNKSIDLDQVSTPSLIRRSASLRTRGQVDRFSPALLQVQEPEDGYVQL